MFHSYQQYCNRGKINNRYIIFIFYKYRILQEEGKIVEKQTSHQLRQYNSLCYPAMLSLRAQYITVWRLLQRPFLAQNCNRPLPIGDMLRRNI